MKILIGCEYSGTVRDAFIARGHDAWSCDLLPTEIAGPHLQCSVLDVLKDGWDMAIFHPPCTFLSNAGIAYFNIDKYGRKALRRIKQRQKSLEFFMKLYYSPIPKIAIENPVGFVNSHLKPTQIIQPYYFGDNDMKTTCLWLKGLQPLVHTKVSDLFTDTITHIAKPEPLHIETSGKKRYFTDMVPGGPSAGHLRSKSFPGIAKAMAEQWG